jgi:hypothetical protein
MLDTEFLYESIIQPKMDNSKENLGYSEQEEETQQSEIDISIANPQLKDDPFPLSPSKYETPPANEPL